MTSIVGREDHLAAGDTFLDAAAKGWAGLILEGEAGIGKTTVWVELVRLAEARGSSVLVARPARAEHELSLATLADLVGQVDAARMAELPELQRRAIDAVLLAGQAD